VREDANAKMTAVSKFEGYRLLGMPRRSLEDIIKVDIKYIMGTDRVSLAEDKDRWQAVSTSVNRGLHKRRRIA